MGLRPRSGPTDHAGAQLWRENFQPRFCAGQRRSFPSPALRKLSSTRWFFKVLGSPKTTQPSFAPHGHFYDLGMYCADIRMIRDERSLLQSKQSIAAGDESAVSSRKSFMTKGERQSHNAAKKIIWNP